MKLLKRIKRWICREEVYEIGSREKYYIVAKRGRR